MKYNVWVEGYSATGQSAPAQQLINPNSDSGMWEADSFKEACKKALIGLKWDYLYYNEASNSYWACRFYDNEKDARIDFG